MNTWYSTVKKHKHAKHSVIWYHQRNKLEPRSYVYPLFRLVSSQLWLKKKKNNYKNVQDNSPLQCNENRQEMKSSHSKTRLHCSEKSSHRKWLKIFGLHRDWLIKALGMLFFFFYAFLHLFCILSFEIRRLFRNFIFKLNIIAASQCHFILYDI